jgi:hypothetical protein
MKTSHASGALRVIISSNVPRYVLAPVFTRGAVGDPVPLRTKGAGITGGDGTVDFPERPAMKPEPE